MAKQITPKGREPKLQRQPDWQKHRNEARSHKATVQSKRGSF